MNYDLLNFVGRIPLPVVELIAKMRSKGLRVDLYDNCHLLMLPLDLGNLDPSITTLDLSFASLSGIVIVFLNNWNDKRFFPPFQSVRN
jgi:hypothetical protein